MCCKKHKTRILLNTNNCDSDPQFNHNPISKDPICAVKNTKTEFSLKYKSGQPQKTKKTKKNQNFQQLWL